MWLSEEFSCSHSDLTDFPLRWLFWSFYALLVYKYTLFDGLAYNTHGYFASCEVNTSNEQNARLYYMFNSIE